MEQNPSLRKVIILSGNGEVTCFIEFNAVLLAYELQPFQNLRFNTMLLRPSDSIRNYK